jgi:hypothetical protein
LERFVVDPVDGPFRQWSGPQGFVESDCRGIPVENGPFEPTALAIRSDPGDRGKQGFADTSAPKLGLDEKIFEVKPWLTAKRGKGMEEEGKADGDSVQLSDDCLSVPARAEQMPAEIIAGCLRLVFQLLVDRQLTNEVRNCFAVIRSCGAYRVPLFFGVPLAAIGRKFSVHGYRVLR